MKMRKSPSHWCISGLLFKWLFPAAVKFVLPNQLLIVRNKAHYCTGSPCKMCTATTFEQFSLMHSFFTVVLCVVKYVQTQS